MTPRSSKRRTRSKPLGSTVADKARSMATALWRRGQASNQRLRKPMLSLPPYSNVRLLLQRETDFKKEMDMLRKENNELRASKRQKGEQGRATATLRNRLEEEDETQHETGSTGLRSALAQLADDEADRASLFDKYKLRGIA
eukprot:g44899.t1